MIQLLNEPDDCKWLREGHLKHYPNLPPFCSFVIEGNEDSPTRIELYSQRQPLFTDIPVNVFEQDHDGDLVPAHNVTVQINVLAELQRAAEHAVQELWLDVQGLQRDGENTDDQEDLIKRWSAAIKKLEDIK